MCADGAGSGLTWDATSGDGTAARPAVALQHTAHAARQPKSSSVAAAQPKDCTGSNSKPHTCAPARTTLPRWTKKQHRRNGILDLWSSNAMASQ